MPDDESKGTSPPSGQQADAQKAAEERQAALARAGFAQPQTAEEYAAQIIQDRTRSFDMGGQASTPTILGAPLPDPELVGARAPEPVISAADIPPPRGAFWANTMGTYITTPKQIWASTSPAALIMSYTLDRSYIAADSYGKRIAIEGTVLAAYPAKGPGWLKQRQGAETAVGVLEGRYDLTETDAFVDVIRGFATLRLDRLIDDGVFGSVAAQAVTDLAAMNIMLVRMDI